MLRITTSYVFWFNSSTNDEPLYSPRECGASSGCTRGIFVPYGVSFGVGSMDRYTKKVPTMHARQTTIVTRNREHFSTISPHIHTMLSSNVTNRKGYDPFDSRSPTK